MEIYLDLVMVLNFLVDFLLLLGTNRLSGFPADPWRCAGAALAGAVYSGVCLLPGFSFMSNFLWRGISLGLMCVLAFGVNASTLKRGGVFLLLTMAMGGAALQFSSGGMGSMVLCACFCLLLSIISFGGQTSGREYVPLKIVSGDKTASFIALKDTGNTLRDPLTGEAVLVVSASVAERLTGLTAIQLRHPMETLTASKISGLRLIPYHSVGNAGNFLLAKRFEHVEMDGKKKSLLVAFAPEGLGNGGIYQALTGGR